MPENNPDAYGLGPIPTPKQVKEKWDEGLRRRRTVDKEAWHNLAFISGEHYSVFNDAQRRFYPPDPRDGRAKLKANLVKPFWRNEVSTLLESDPIAETIAASDSDEDRHAAEAGNRILTFEFDRLGLSNDKKLTLVSWLTAAGVAYVHVTWDKEADEVAAEVVPHFEVVPDPACRNSLEEGYWVIHGRVMTKDEAFEKFGKEFPAKDMTSTFDWQKMFQGGDSGGMPVKDGVLVMQMWHKPSRRYPEGFVVTVVGDQYAEEPKPFSFDHGRLPFVDFHHIRIPGRFEGQSMLVDLIPVQKDYNAARSRMAEIRALNTLPQIWAPEGSLDVDRIAPKPGQVIFYRPIGPYKPEVINGPAIPAFLFQQADAAYREMQDIAGQHEVSRGEVPASGIPAAGLIALQEKDERKVATTIRSLEKGIARVGKQVLGLVQQFWTEDRAVRVWSEDTGETAVTYFSQADINSSLDVWVVPGSGIPRGKAQQRQDAIALWRERVIQDPRLLLRLMQFPGTDATLRVMDEDARQAKREHDRIYKGDPPETHHPEEWHNHSVHISEHNSFRKSEMFEGWDEMQRAALADHVAQHEQMMQAQMQRELMQQMAMGAAPEQDTGAIPGVNAPENSQEVM